MANRQLTTGGMIVAGTAGAFLLDSFIPWHRECFELFGNKTCGSESAWGTPFSLLATLLAVAVLAEVIAVQVLDQKLPEVGTLTWSQIRLGAAVAILVLVFIQLLAGDHGVGRGVGIFIGLLLAAGIVYGTVVRNKEPQPIAS